MSEFKFYLFIQVAMHLAMGISWVLMRLIEVLD